MKKNMSLRSCRASAIWLPAALALSGCATLPKAGPTGAKIVKAAQTEPFELVEVNALDRLPPTQQVAELLPSQPGMARPPQSLAPGDVISISLYEVGVRLFSAASGMAGTQFDPSARGEKLPPLSIDENGNIRLPYIGTVQAAGLSPTQLAARIERLLAGKSQFPQVVVTLDVAAGSAILISGEIANPGRVRLSAARERLKDVIALAGGNRGLQSDILVRVVRNGLAVEARLDALSDSNLGAMPMEAGDRVELIRSPRTYSVLGSTSKVSQFPFQTQSVSLVEALALAGGANENLGDPAAVFVFRFEKRGEGQPDRAVVYHINMMRPVSYFIAQKFLLTDKDVLYVGGAAANQPTKLIQTIGQLFTPILLARQLSN